MKDDKPHITKLPVARWGKTWKCESAKTVAYGQNPSTALRNWDEADRIAKGWAKLEDQRFTIVCPPMSLAWSL